ncbi:hypothetical protein HUA74_29290 [Myxococcus sp. CA051A]|uniref:Uncharacterized protein n=1 Tax=Myxococcus llanfairpwllgwyngyllgogerychwyrndrobwllllantysiliogogogochensis TaxID=2590453 RepID=A0A540WNZ7_9BACT|nr:MULTISPECIES: hypothetical protein [Myxococcus]NTX36445.1 hypothetical protein [Myxococcus sp. CA033]NTX57804.1 hypothetical protein [Myxococcus sp. CA039A]NTX64753.1 hypothetical protein [Myxococcus sp. CA051A]TQF10752.1 hypothetical protein FJV41_37765 [Myxococcus llanfairpwllgwyngyllgogerychwyrndrobwllllantysiliogogogochensis]
MVAPVNGGSRSTSTAKTSQAEATPSDPKAEQAKQQAIIDDIGKKPETKLTTEDRAKYADAVGTNQVLQNQPFLSFFSKSTTESLTKKLDADVAKYTKENPKASLKDIESHVKDRFKAQMFSAVVAQKGVDMAIANLKKQLQKIRDGFDE